jgi:hypothetical protein
MPLNYDQPAVVQKRVRWFNGQKLLPQEFIDEQRYHLDREHRQSKLLGTVGIVSGLKVTTAKPNQITVSEGVAVDAKGRQLILSSNQTLQLSEVANQQRIEVFLIYQETATDLAGTGSDNYTRWDETPKIAVRTQDNKTVAAAPPGVPSTWDGVLLAYLAVDNNGKVTVEDTEASKAGLSVPGNVGIGTTVPESAEGGTKVVDILGTTSTKLSIRTKNVDARITADDKGRFGAPAGMTVGTAGTKTSNALSFVTNETTRLTVLPDGNVGIGTTEPKSKLTVTGGGNKSVDLEVNGRLRSNNNDGGLWISQDRFVGGHDTNKISLWNGNTWRLTVLPNGNVGIGTTDPDCKLTVNGDIRGRDIYSTGMLYFHPGAEWAYEDEFGPRVQRYWYIFRPRWNVNDFSESANIRLRASDKVFPSDTRLKNDVNEIASALQKIEQLRGVSFAWNEQGLRHLTADIESMVSAGPEASAAENQLLWDKLRQQCCAKLMSRRNIGLVAQDVEQVLPELVYTNADGYKCVDYNKMTAVLVQAVKEQQASIQQLRDRLVTLERVTT